VAGSPARLTSLAQEDGRVRIAEIEVAVVDIPLMRPVVGVHGRTSVQRSVLARVVADDASEGWGDVDPTPGYSRVTAEDVARTVRELAPALIGLDPFDIHRALATMDARVDGRLEAKAVVEMALWDLKGRALGRPVHDLLGGRVKDEVTLNAWIGAVPPAQAAREAREWLARGFVSAKIKVSGAGGGGVDRVAAVRDAVGERMALRVDFNESLPREAAVAVIDRLERYRLVLCEQPVPRDDIDGLAAIRRAVRTPIMADESVQGPASLLEIIRRKAADIVKVKVMKQGGLLRTAEMVATAAAAGMRVVIGHGFGLALSTLAEAHVAATSEAIMAGCEAVGPLKMADDVVLEPLRLEHGVIKLTSVPGLGVSVDVAALRRRRVATV
jgi:muconate cycloisomerase